MKFPKDKKILTYPEKRVVRDYTTGDLSFKTAIINHNKKPSCLLFIH